jgi:periplasmic protein TonB
MMMALRQSRAEQVLFQALDASAPRPRLSRGAMLAIAISAAAHVCLLAYLTVQHFAVPQAPETDVAPVTVTTVRLPPPPTVAAKQPVDRPAAAPARELPAATPTHSAVLARPTFQPTQLDFPASGDVQIGPLVSQKPAPVIVDPRWLSQPSADDLSRFYPERALDLGLTGHASLTCGVLANGGLTGCRVLAETPAHAGFGEAALRLAPYFRMSPRTVDGQPVDGGTVNFGISFDLADPR